MKTVDALHLGQALALHAEVTIVTHDDAMASAARSLGLSTIDPIRSA